MTDKSNDFGMLDYFLDIYPSTKMMIDSTVDSRNKIKVKLWVWESYDYDSLQNDDPEIVTLFTTSNDPDGLKRLANCIKYLESQDTNELYLSN